MLYLKRLIPANQWEVFCPMSGELYYTTKYRRYAQLLAWFHGLDYAHTGEGWVD